ncbi:MAG: MarR family transcriptional regulator [Actinobacteria bacterium]|nr:MarR family transcriptional regulator [Actinomycetota bacterium]
MPRRTAPGTDSAAAESLFVSTVRLARRLRQVADARLTPSQHSVMMSIHRHGPLTLGELADLERVAQPTISRVVAKLEGDGLVERMPDATDGRVVRVVVTPDGAELLEAARSRKVAWIDDRLAQLTPEERDHLLAALPALERLQALP